jgi:recombinational DNA repair protein RecT
VQKAGSLREAISIAQDRWVKNYNQVTGKSDGEQRFETELLNYLDIVNEKPELKKIQDKWMHFAAVMKAGQTGLSFRSEGHLYPIVYGGTIKVQIGAHGKRDMLKSMKEIKFVHEAQIVLKGDDFIHDKLNNRILKHTSSGKVSKITIDEIVASYCRLEYTDGRIVDVVVYHDDLVKAKAASKNNGAGSVWEKWPGEMCKKVSYHRAKKLYHRYPETADFQPVGSDDDYEDDPGSFDPAQVVDTETGEIMEQPAAEEATVIKEDKKSEPQAYI